VYQVGTNKGITKSLSWWQHNFLVYFTPEHIPDYDFSATSTGWSFQGNGTEVFFTSCAAMLTASSLV